MKKISILLVGFLLIGCGDTNNTNIEMNIPQEINSPEVQEYLDSLPDNDMNSPEYELPADPGEQGKEELLGIDSNDNGIRDDVEIYIYNKYKNDENKRVAYSIFSQDAKSVSKILKNPERGYEDEIYKIFSRNLQCNEYWIRKKSKNTDIDHYFELGNTYNLTSSKFKDIIYDTRERQKAYFTYQASLGGHSFSLGKNTIDDCDQNITILDK